MRCWDTGSAYRGLGAEGRLGSWIRLAGKPFQVVGILERVGTQLSRDRLEIDDHVWLPISTVQSSWPVGWTEEPVVNKIIYQMRDRHALEETEREVRAILAELLNVAPDDEEAVGIWSSLEMLRKLPLDQTPLMLLVLATATLMIGGIGVLNRMLDSVHERCQEIGMRLAVGARRRDIMSQFFVETLAITCIGGGVGAILGVGAVLYSGRWRLRI